MFLEGGSTYMISPIRKFAGFACECRTFENYINTQKALHVNVGLYFCR